MIRTMACAALTGALLCTAVTAAAAEPPLALEATIPLGAVSGRIDHMAFDPGRSRLLVAELGNGTVAAVDLAAGHVSGRLTDLKQPQGVAYVPGADLIAVASAGDGSVRLFHAADLTVAGRIDLGDDADNLRIGPADGRLVAGYGKGGLAVIDPAAGTVAARIPLPAHPEGFQLAPDGGRAFVNLPDAGQIAVVDMVAGQVAASWPTGRLRANFPMAFGMMASGPMASAGPVLAVIFRSPPRLAMIDAASGVITADRETCGDADDVFFDIRRRRSMVSCGEGAVDLFDHTDAGLRHLARIRTRPGARTALFVPQLDRFYIAARADSVGEAAILVFRPAH